MACTTCPAGSYCPENATATIACETGMYAIAGLSSCLTCPGGTQCSDPTIAPVSCVAGTYSLGNATTCIPCPNGGLFYIYNYWYL